jgi:hypothetical protein
MQPELNVVLSALRDEARKWHGLNDTVEPVKTVVQGLTLAPTAFFIGDANVVVHSQAYDGFQAFMVTILGGAVTEFEQLGAALNKIADIYDEADRVIAVDLNEVYSA